MSGTPNSPFRAWVKPSRNTNGDKLRLPAPGASEPAEERKADLKRAAFFVTVAVLFVLVNHVGHVKEASDANSGAGSAGSVSLTVALPERIVDGFSVRFRLNNKGYHSVFYPVGTGTNAPVGQIVARTSPSSEWMTLSGNSVHGVSAIQESMDSNLAWIEVPPGGWVDGEFRDARESPGEHAYAIFLKPARNANAVMVVSNSYPSLANSLKDQAILVQ